MDDKESQEIYLKKYIQKQETLLLDFLRKTLDLEIRSSILSKSLNDINLKYEESQKQIVIQNEIMQQAANGVESLTKEKNVLEKNLEDCKNERYALSQELQEYKQKNNSLSKTIEDLREEYNRQTEELNVLYKQTNDLKTKPPINKKKSKATLPSDEF